MHTFFQKRAQRQVHAVAGRAHNWAKTHDVKEDEFISRSINVPVLVQVILRTAQYPAALMNGVCWIVFGNFAD